LGIDDPAIFDMDHPGDFAHLAGQTDKAEMFTGIQV